jgi:hypothetical protein
MYDVKSGEKGGPASIRMAMMRQKDQGQEAPRSGRYAGFDDALAGSFFKVLEDRLEWHFSPFHL